jgi:hypothetical protein
MQQSHLRKNEGATAFEKICVSLSMSGTNSMLALCVMPVRLHPSLASVSRPRAALPIMPPRFYYYAPQVKPTDVIPPVSATERLP